MIASITLTALFSLLLVVGYKKGVVITAMTIQVLSYLGTGIPSVKLFFALSVLALALYVPNRRRLSLNPYPKWLVAASLLFLVSYAVTTACSDFMHWQTVVVNAIGYFGFPFVLWKCLDSPRQVKLALKTLAGLMTVATLLGLFEAVFRVNPVYGIIEDAFVIEDFSIDSDAVRFGLKRCNSIFSYFSTYGVACFVAFVVFYVRSFMLRVRGRWTPYLMFLCAFGAFATGSRAVFLGLFTALFLLLVNKRFFKTKVGFAFVCLAFFLLPVLLTIGFQVVDSMVNSNTSRFATGSSSDLRTMQWEACLPYFLDSPWVGNGRMYIWDVVKEAHFELLGAESIWFSILVDYGLLGALAFVFLIFACAKQLLAYNFRLICLPVGYLFILSLSPDTGITYNTLLSFTILIMRMFQYYPTTSKDK